MALPEEEDHDSFSTVRVHTELSLIVNDQKHETQQKAIEEMPLQVSHCIFFFFL